MLLELKPTKITTYTAVTVNAIKNLKNVQPPFQLRNFVVFFK